MKLVEILRKGIRYCKKQNAFIYQEKGKMEDREKNLTNRGRTIVRILEVMNAMNPGIHL